MNLLLVLSIFYYLAGGSAGHQHEREILEIMRPNPYVDELNLRMRVSRKYPMISNENIHSVWLTVITHAQIPEWMHFHITDGKAKGDSPRTIAERIVYVGVQSGFFRPDVTVNPFVTVVAAWITFCADKDTHVVLRDIAGQQFYVMTEDVVRRWIDFFINRLDAAAPPSTPTAAPMQFEDNLLESVRQGSEKYAAVAVQPVWFILFLFDYHAGAKPWTNPRIIDLIVQKGKETGNPVNGSVKTAIELWWKIAVLPIRQGVEWTTVYAIDPNGFINGITQSVIRVLPERLLEFQG
jgi:hypothetical protein